MSDEQGLLAAIWDQPHDDTPRLVYADWLDEHDQPERAEFVRVQCAAARLDEGDPHRAELDRRAAALRRKHGSAWKAGLPPSFRSAGYDRGFVYPRRAVETARFLRLPAGEWAAAPLWDLTLNRPSRKAIAAVAADPRLLRAGRLTVSNASSDQYLHPTSAGLLVGSENVRNLTHLTLSGNDIGSAPLVALCDRPPPHLHSLTVIACQDATDLIDTSFPPAMAVSELAGRLTVLDAAANDLPLDAWRPVFEAAPRFGKLNALGLDVDTVGAEDIGEFLRSCPAFPALRVLRAHWSYGQSSAGLRFLADWPGLAGVRELHLDGSSPVTAADARALAASPHAGGLRLLTYVSAGREAAAALRRRFGDVLEGK
ncbi:MAG: hypothetical protein C0501_26540 [Isosphaera sp.]|nr:hypothetical protein [Isosphaera sp.]